MRETISQTVKEDGNEVIDAVALTEIARVVGVPANAEGPINRLMPREWGMVVMHMIGTCIRPLYQLEYRPKPTLPMLEALLSLVEPDSYRVRASDAYCAEWMAKECPLVRTSANSRARSISCLRLIGLEVQEGNPETAETSAEVPVYDLTGIFALLTPGSIDFLRRICQSDCASQTNPR